MRGTMPPELICADVLDALAEIEPGSVQLVFADPPYNIGVDYGKGRSADDLPEAEYLAWCHDWMKAVPEVLAPGGSLWVLICERWSDDYGKMLSEIMPRRNRIIWHETFAQYASHNFTSEHRHLFYHVKPGAPHTWNIDTIRIPSARQAKYNDKRANPNGRVPGNVWRFPRVCGTFKARVDWHPAQLPVALLERAILCSSNPGDTVLDLFAGSGSMLKACQLHAREFIGIDNNPDYCANMADLASGVPA